MENDFLRFSPKRVLYSVVMVSALWVGNPQKAFADTGEVQVAMQSGMVKVELWMLMVNQLLVLAYL